jgi:tetratricopeptide (TPR) repeat protein
MSTAKIEELVIDFSTDAFNPEKNFAVAVEYEKQNQIASAISFYLRTAEYGYETTEDLVYTSLLKISACFNKQGGRPATVTGALLQALSFMPERPEAYFLMSQLHERKGEWQEAYTWADMGLHADYNLNGTPLPADVGYEGRYVLEFEKAVSGWWIGRRDESEKLFEYLLSTYSMKADYVNSCNANLNMIRGTNAS